MFSTKGFKRWGEFGSFEDGVDVVFDGAFGGVGDEEVVAGEEGLEEEALVEFMVEWFEEDEDGKKDGKEDLFNLKA
ncbi:hypothetical protein Tco_0680422 [Tanacetum coccineum]|uniref:Uncharacterized protein n=1 Tax=Tanacetum coccineum TaxID=301880 RepID=A0ABQ4XLM9_9ASTR